MNVNESNDYGANSNGQFEEPSQVTIEDSNTTIGSDESKHLLSSTSKLNISITWTDLCYVVSDFKWFPAVSRNTPFFQKRERMILHPQSGQLSNGCLMALIGKSGAGKSTLIESLTGRRRKGLKGNVCVNVHSEVYPIVDEKDVKIAFIPQNDAMLETLTVYESILFATKLKNRGYSLEEHEKVIKQLLNQFGLNVCKSNRVSKCSGGEKKRLSVAMELVSKPNVLVLDEPTSGLDSSSALQCIKLLRKLTQSTSNPLAIMVSIHQPSAKLLEEFHSLYLLSYDGRCLYNGPVKNLLSVFEKFNVPCPQYHNPADHALEVSSGDYGKAVVDTMADYVSNNQQLVQVTHNTTHCSVTSIIEKMRNHSGASFFSHCSTLTARNLKATFRDPILNYCRLLLEVAAALATIAIYSSEIGNESGCTSHSENGSSTTFSLKKLRELNGLLVQNIGLFMVLLLFTLFASTMPIVLVFPTEMKVFLRERTNGWYSCLSFYLAKTIADTPFLLVYTAIFSLIVYYPTGQLNENWRVVCYLMILMLIAFFGQTMGMIIGTVFVKNAHAAAFVAPVSVVPFSLFAGFFVKICYIPTYLHIFSYLSCMRYGFEALVIIVYGFDRCSQISEEYHESMNDVILNFVQYLTTLNLSYADARPMLKSVVFFKNRPLSELEPFDIRLANFTTSQLNILDLNQNESIPMQEYELKDYYLWTHTLILIVFVIILKVLSYILLLRRANNRN